VRITRRQAGAFVTAVAFAVLPPLLDRAGVLNTSSSRTLGVGACFVAMALSLNLLMGYAGQISLGHGALLSVGAYTAGLITGRYYLPAGLGLVAAAVAGGAVAFIIGLPALRVRGLYLAITTVAFTVVMEQSILQIPWLSRGSAGVVIPRPYFGHFGFNRNADYLAFILVIVVAFVLLDANVVRTKLGRAFLGIRENEQVAQSFGVDVARYKLLAFTLSGAMAGVAGALYGHLAGFVNSEVFRFDRFSLLLVVIVVIGGLGHRNGVIAAAAIYAVLPRLLTAFEGWDLIIGAILLMYAVVRHPGGFAEAIHEARTARASKLAREGRSDDADDDTIPALPDLPRPPGLAPRPGVARDALLLDVRDVVVRFGGLAAVDGASLAVPHGKIVGLIGPNGAGKSTLFNAVSGFVTVQGGSVRYAGTELRELAPHARARLGIGRTFQQVGLARNLSVLENLLLAQHTTAPYTIVDALGYLPGAGRVEAMLRERSRATIAALGFERFTETPVKHLSGGQQRIVEMACALVTAPELLMLDEPSAGMAPAAVENLAVRLREVRDELGRTILLIEHHIPLVLDVCDDVYVLDSGRVIAQGTPDAIVADPLVISAYLGDAPLTQTLTRPRARRAPARKKPAGEAVPT
jgi:branched-chain amino acid transport system ATP-binding protein/branched-chain amino acid transport system permease protein